MIRSNVVLAHMLAAWLGTGAAGAQQPHSQQRTVRVMVTVTKAQVNSPGLNIRDLDVRLGRFRTEAAVLQPAHGPLELYVAIDDDSSHNLDRCLGALRNFIASQPSDTRVGLVYLSDSDFQAAAALTTDHAAVARAVRAPKAQPDISPSPYESIEKLVAKWNAAPDTRREILMLSNGQEHLGGNRTNDPIVLRVLDELQRTHVAVLGIGVLGAEDPAGMSEESSQSSHRSRGKSSREDPNSPAVDEQMSGYSILQMVSEKSGGFYTQQAGPADQFESLMNTTAARLRRQWTLAIAVPLGTPAGLTPLRVESHVRGLSVSAPAAVMLLP